MSKDETILKTKKINLNKIVGILWGVLITSLAIIFIISLAGYAEYEKGQEIAVVVSVVTGMENPVTYGVEDIRVHDNNYKELVSALYEEYNPSEGYLAIYEHNLGREAAERVKNLYREADKALGEVLTNEGYDCYYGSYYLKFTSLFAYTRYFMAPEIQIWRVIALCLIVLTIWYFLDKKKELLIDGSNIICKNGTKTVKQFMLKDVKCISFTALRGLKIQGNGIKYTINLVENRDEIKSIITTNLVDNPIEQVL